MRGGCLHVSWWGSCLGWAVAGDNTGYPLSPNWKILYSTLQVWGDCLVPLAAWMQQCGLLPVLITAMQVVRTACHLGYTVLPQPQCLQKYAQKQNWALLLFVITLGCSCAPVPLMTDCDVCQSPYLSKSVLWLITWVPICTYSIWRRLSTLEQSVGFFLIWAAWKLAEMQKEPTNQPIAEKWYSATLVRSAVFGCSVAAVQFPPARSCRTDPSDLTVVWYPQCSCAWLVGCLGNSVFLPVLLQKCYISEMKYVICMSNGMGHFHRSLGSPQAWHIAYWRAAKGKHLGKKKSLIGKC